MAEKITNRKPRADAERNRQRLLEVAKGAFAEKGVSASLEEIAREAGLGIGTLYRHFPTREALIDEIYRDEGSRLAEAAQRLSAELAPLDAVREWLLLFVGYLANKQIQADVLNCMVGGDDRLCTLSVDALIEALTLLIQRAKQSGEIRLAIEPLDLLCAVAGVATFGADTDWEASARRLVELMISGLRGAGGRQSVDW
ncbi:TetR/AcrR family transcriptional regulator [Ralstonia solanacearum]|uniref:TetR family transcriptional regulator n=1 Tax=Ralstonia solanacearum TaxID=305 RepID=A0AAD0SHW0_RALSL|nr:TetR family transcriptional regulator [Ralstonia solanacearum]AXV84787.1 TetR family transcriptional regulator [Ralstonia solanacearum]AXW55567.1 TetR family transcriptional regulator [Ralstonia solanacearum]CBJ35780.1 putative transcription regulator protein, TetR family [Ralstonia solanacearum PSI07]